MYTPMSTSEKTLYYVVVFGYGLTNELPSPVWNEQRRKKSEFVAGNEGS